jgi:hypothetical protein
MAMPQMAIMDFVQRFHALQAHRDSGNELIKVFFLPFYKFPIVPD